MKATSECWADTSMLMFRPIRGLHVRSTTHLVAAREELGKGEYKLLRIADAAAVFGWQVWGVVSPRVTGVKRSRLA